MSRQAKEPTWPFLCILACLFVLSAAAPRAWEKTIRTRDACPPTGDVVHETDAVDTHGDDIVACQTVAPEEATPGQTEVAESPQIRLTAQLSVIGPSLKNENGLLVVVPSPRISNRAIDPGLVDLDLIDEAVDRESMNLLPPYTANLFVTEDPDASVAMDFGAGNEELADPITFGEPISPIADVDNPEVTDDQDLNAVAGVSVLTTEQVANLASGRREKEDRLDETAPWTSPVSIYRQLEPLEWDCETGQWARELTEAVGRAAADLADNSVDAKESVARLSVLGQDGVKMAEAKEGDEREELRRVLISLHRCVSVWRRVVDALPGAENQLEPVDWAQVGRAIEQMQHLTAEAENGSAWDSYLELDKLAEIARRQPERLTDDERTLVCCIHLNLEVADVTQEQLAFLESEEISEFKDNLQSILARPVDGADWIGWVEAVERTNSPTAGERLAIERLILSTSKLCSHLELADVIQEIYCSPNVRIAVTGYLLNRMLPDREPEYQWVRDTVLGHPVQGRSRTIADIGFALIPDSQRMRAALTVDGLVSASTSSTAGPATFINDSTSEYAAVKELELTPMGIRFQPAKVSVDNRIALRQIQTDFDGIPLVGPIVHSVARSQHDASRSAVRHEMNRKVQGQAEKQIDEEVDARLGELNERLKNRLLDPLAAMSLRPEVVDAKTTEARMSMRLKLAGAGQLGSNTPRPWAPSDSVLSFQMHQSALNNILRGLELDGATLTIKELRERIATRFNRPEMFEESMEHDDVTITFADADAARVDFDEDRIAVSLGVARLHAEGRQWRNFRVRAYYRPETSRRSATLVRDGVVELIGRMRMGSQITLRSVFSKVFAKGRELTVVPQEMAADPRLQGLDVTQLMMDDGWFALAVGPERLRHAMAKSPASATIK